jgi:hypothetical protein
MTCTEIFPLSEALMASIDAHRVDAMYSFGDLVG